MMLAEYSQSDEWNMGPRLMDVETLRVTYLPSLVDGNRQIFSRLIQFWFVAKYHNGDEVRFGTRER